MENKELIIIKQLPLIEENLKELSIEIDGKVENAKNLVCTEENVKTIKELRASLNKDFKEVEEQRKLVKEKVLAPYMKFEEIYKQYVSDKYKCADVDLKTKIDTVENELKIKKEQDVRNYFEEYKIANNIDFIQYEKVNINVTLTASMKSLKEQAKVFIDKIVDDLKLIEMQEYKAEILVEYKQSLNVSNSITTVINRFKAIKEEKKRQEQKQFIKEASEVVIVQAPKNKYAVTEEFKIIPTKNKIQIILNVNNEEKERVKQFLKLSNIEYESEEL